MTTFGFLRATQKVEPFVTLSLQILFYDTYRCYHGLRNERAYGCNMAGRVLSLPFPWVKEIHWIFDPWISHDRPTQDMTHQHFMKLKVWLWLVPNQSSKSHVSWFILSMDRFSQKRRVGLVKFKDAYCSKHSVKNTPLWESSLFFHWNYFVVII